LDQGREDGWHSIAWGGLQDQGRVFKQLARQAHSKSENNLRTPDQKKEYEKMALRIVHINKEATDQEAAAIKLAEVLGPKWDAKLKKDAIKWCIKHKIDIPEHWLEEDKHT
jgi:hypothetical protein